MSIPAGIFTAAVRRQVVSGSPHASTQYVQWPSSAGATTAPQRSVPGASSRMGVQGPERPSGPRSTTLAATASWPSRKTVAVISKDSPLTDLAGRLPPWTSGRTSRTGMRPMGVFTASPADRAGTGVAGDSGVPAVVLSIGSFRRPFDAS